MQQEKGLVWSLFESEGMTAQEVVNANRATMSDVAKRHRSKYLVTYTDIERFREAVENMLGISNSHFPAIAVQKKAGDKKRYIHTGAMTADAISRFISDVDAGRVEPYLKSEVEPPAATNINAKIQSIVGK